MWYCDYLACGTYRVSTTTVGGIVNPTISQSQVPLMLTGIPVVPAGPVLILATVDPPHHPPVPLHHGHVSDLLNCITRSSQAVPVRREVRQTAVLCHALEKTDEDLVIDPQGHLTLKLT